jgi:uncharacterized PurR-regulated membrane protein YhhQ (DUF165 family)
MKTAMLSVAFLGTIPAANWLIGHVGTTCVPQGPCLIPVAPGMLAPSGVLLIGAALALRDALHERVPRWQVVALIVVGALLSLVFSPPALATASGVAFLLSELADFVVYDKLRRRALWGAVLASGLAGAVLDSLLFSWLAFGVLNWAPGLIVAKMYASAAFAGWHAWRRLTLAADRA